MGEFKHDGLAVPGRVVLAHEPPFALGKANVDPATRQIEVAGRRETLEPRVMQVLVALARADGAIVTRDELIELCWDGRIVTDDAINRVLSRIRQIAADIGGGSFSIETIARVGYRLTESGRTRAARPPAIDKIAEPQGQSRRAILVAAGVAAAGAGLLAWQQPWRHRPPARARELFRRGDSARREATASELPQARDYFQEAVRIDPLYSDAWGALAFSYIPLIGSDTAPEGPETARLVRSAAERALALDPGNADAQVALLAYMPWYRHWASFELSSSALLRHFPRHWDLRTLTGLFYYDVGRWEPGIDQFAVILRDQPLLPVAQAALARGLWYAGRLQEAESALSSGIERWPAYFPLWDLRWWFLAVNGRLDEADLMARNQQSQPFGLSPTSIPRRFAFVQALRTHAASDIDKALSYFHLMAGTGRDGVPRTIQACAALGRIDEAFSGCAGYFFDEGPFAHREAPVSRYSQLTTHFLFGVPTAGMRTDPRFADLLRRTGLEDYWRQTRTIPDFRRTA